MRKPTVENKYNLKPGDITKAIILDRDKLTQPPFWRNDVVEAWCLSGGTGQGSFGGDFSSYWIGFYDENAKAYAGKIRIHCSTYDDMCDYKFNTFFNPKDIENEFDLELQEKLLETLNWLVDKGIVEVPNTQKRGMSL